VLALTSVSRSKAGDLNDEEWGLITEFLWLSSVALERQRLLRDFFQKICAESPQYFCGAGDNLKGKNICDVLNRSLLGSEILSNFKLDPENHHGIVTYDLCARVHDQFHEWLTPAIQNIESEKLKKFFSQMSCSFIKLVRNVIKFTMIAQGAVPKQVMYITGKMLQTFLIVHQV
jgi:hypothetical protein